MLSKTGPSIFEFFYCISDNACTVLKMTNSCVIKILEETEQDFLILK